jgi:hypothetical protein
VTELRLQIDDSFLQDLRIKLRRNAKASEIVRDALTVYNWAAEERANGRFVVSMDADGGDMARLVLPALEQAVPPALRAKTATASDPVEAPPHPKSNAAVDA